MPKNLLYIVVYTLNIKIGIWAKVLLIRLEVHKNHMDYLKYFTFLTVFFSVILLCSCSTTFTLPPHTQGMEKIYLLKYSTWGHHSLAFYREGRLTEYTYGDWDLFALNKRDGWTAWKNMTFHTQGAFGRKSIAIKSGDSICNKFLNCETVIPFYAPTDKVNILREDLERKYANEINTEVYNEDEDVHFVKFDVPYWAFHNCNHQLVEWLEFLGAEVKGRVFYNPTLIDGMKPKQAPIEIFQ